MDVVHFADPRYSQHGIAQRNKIDVLGRSLHEDIGALFEQQPRPWQDKDSNEKADNRISSIPMTEIDNDARDYDANRDHEIAPNLQIGGASVNRLSIGIA